MRALPFCLLLSLAACGSAGTQPRCSSDADCGPGTACTRPVSGEAGVCVAPYRVAITAPGASAWVGASTAVRATVAAQVGGRALPGAIDLLAGAAPAGQLQRDGASQAYLGTWVPPPGTPATVALRAVAARGTADESSSAPVAVRVDLEAPLLGAVAVECAGTCLRDGTLTVRAPVSDPNLAAVTASLDLDPVRSFPLVLSGAEWRAEVDLRSYPFPHLSGPVSATVKGTDLAGNEATGLGSALVTRVRWAYDAGAPVTSPAVAADGTLVVGVSATANQLRAVRPDGTELWKATVGSSFITAAPSIGGTTIWAGSEDGKLYSVAADGSGVVNGSGCATGGKVRGTPAIISSPSEVAVAGSAAGRVYAADAIGMCAAGPVTEAFSSAPAISSRGRILVATSTAASALKDYVFDGLAFTQEWSVLIGVSVIAPVALDQTGNAWTGSNDAKLNSTTIQGETAIVRTLGGSIVESPVVLASGDVVVGDQSSVLHRIKPDGTLVWSPEPTLTGGLLAPLVLTAGDAALIVPTTAGTLHAVGGDGAVIWQGALSAQALRAGNISNLAGAAFSTAYFGGDDGKLYAVVVDGHLDTAAPWPKAHHDVRNTSNAGSSLP